MNQTTMDASTQDGTENSSAERSSGTVPHATAPSRQDLEASDELRRAQLSFRTLIELSPELVLLHRDGLVVHTNPAVVRALGFESAAEMVGTSLALHFHADDQPTVTT